MRALPALANALVIAALALLVSYAIDQASGALKLLQKYPTGKGANWVEIVGFD